MKTLVTLDKIENNIAYVTDTKSENQYQSTLTDDEVYEYQSMIDEAKQEELADEETGVLLGFNTETRQIEPINNEMELF